MSILLELLFWGRCGGLADVLTVVKIRNGGDGLCHVSVGSRSIDVECTPGVDLSFGGTLQVWRQARWCVACRAAMAVLGRHEGGDDAQIDGGVPIDGQERQPVSHYPI